MGTMLQYDVPEYKKIRLIVDTDAACEADDPFAIAQALMTKKFDIRALVAAHFGERGTVQRSFDEIETVLRCMEMDVPHFMGEDGPLTVAMNDAPSPAVEFLIQEALRLEERPLFVLCLGAITNVARALKECPDIMDKMTVVWIGCHQPGTEKVPFREFNAGNDIEAANFVLQSGVKLWLIPSNVYGTMRISLAEIQRRIYPCGEIGQHLFENMEQYNRSEFAGWTAGESWTLGDNPAVGVAMDESCGRYRDMIAPFIQPDTATTLQTEGPLIRVYEYVDSRFVLEDMMSKLELLYRKK